MKTTVVAVTLAAVCFASTEAQRIKLPVKLPELEKIAHADSNDAAAHYNVGLGYWSAKRYAAADTAFRLASRLDPRFALPYLARAYLPFAERAELWDELEEDRVPAVWEPRLEESRRLYRRAFMVDPMVDLRIIGSVVPPKSAFWDADEELSRIYDDWVRGFDDFRDAKYESAYLRLDRMIEEWTATGKRNVKRVPDYLLWYHGLAAAHLKRHEQAIDDLTDLLDRSLKKERNDSLIYVPLQTNELRYLLGAVKAAAGRPQEAVPLFREVASQDIGQFMAHVQLAEISNQLGQLDDALRHRQLAVEANPEDATLLTDLGVAQVRVGRRDEGARTLADAIALNPRDARPHYLLGMLEIQRGNKDRAATSFRTFIALAPKRFGPQITDAQQKLSALK